MTTKVDYSAQIFLIILLYVQELQFNYIFLYILLKYFALNKIYWSKLQPNLPHFFNVMSRYLISMIYRHFLLTQ